MNQKISLLIWIVLFISPAAWARNDLTPAQQKEALNEVDSTCGDTWCEGDYTYTFSSIGCDFGSQECVLDFEMGLEESVGDAAKTFEATIKKKSPVSCAIKGVQRYEQVVEKRSSGYQRLASAFYSKLTSCINSLERRLRK